MTAQSQIAPSPEPDGRSRDCRDTRVAGKEAKTLHAELEDFKTGWYGVAIYLREEEIDLLIEQLAGLRRSKDQHSHISISGASEAEGSIADIEFNVQEGEQDDMFFTGFAIPPTR